MKTPSPPSFGSGSNLPPPPPHFHWYLTTGRNLLRSSTITLSRSTVAFALPHRHPEVSVTETHAIVSSSSRWTAPTPTAALPSTTTPSSMTTKGPDVNRPIKLEPQDDSPLIPGLASRPVLSSRSLNVPNPFLVAPRVNTNPHHQGGQGQGEKIIIKFHSLSPQPSGRKKSAAKYIVANRAKWASMSAAQIQATLKKCLLRERARYGTGVVGVKKEQEEERESWFVLK